MTPHWTRDLCIWHYTGWRNVGLVICASDIVQNDAMLDSWYVHLTLYRMTPCWTRDLIASSCIMSDTQITSPTWCHSVQCQMHISRVQHGVILYNVRCTDHESNMASFCTMSDTQITSPTWHHSVNVRYTDHESNMASFCKCQIHRSRVQHAVILYNVRCTDHESNMASFCTMSDAQITSPSIWHYIEWRHVGLVICVSDIIQNESMLDLWSVYLTLYRMASCWPCDRVSDIIQNDAMLD